jgi:hypothetical protein
LTSMIQDCCFGLQILISLIGQFLLRRLQMATLNLVLDLYELL